MQDGRAHRSRGIPQPDGPRQKLKPALHSKSLLGAPFWSQAATHSTDPTLTRFRAPSRPRRIVGASGVEGSSPLQNRRHNSPSTLPRGGASRQQSESWPPRGVRQRSGLGIPPPTSPATESSRVLAHCGDSRLPEIAPSELRASAGDSISRPRLAAGSGLTPGVPSKARCQVRTGPPAPRPISQCHHAPRSKAPGTEHCPGKRALPSHRNPIHLFLRP